MKAMLTGDCGNTWADKSFNYVVSANGCVSDCSLFLLNLFDVIHLDFAQLICCCFLSKFLLKKIPPQFGGTTEHSIADGCDLGAIQENYSFMEQHIVPLVANTLFMCMFCGNCNFDLHVSRYAPLIDQQIQEELFDAEENCHLRFAERLEFDVNDEVIRENQKIKDY